jgi:MYXO-CTERM domain-containing protein
LRLVGVRDWRIFVVVFLSFPMVSSLKLGQLDALLALGCALAWRWRRTPGLRLALCVGAVVAATLLVWPLLIWLAAMGRTRHALAAGAFGAALLASGWAVIGFSSLRSYPHLMSALTDAFATQGYSLAAVGSRLGVSLDVAKFLPLVALVVLCALAWRWARCGREADAFVAAVGAAILGSPILWLHYVVIVLVAVAVKRPTFHPAWLLPLAFWFTPGENPGSGLELAVGLGLLMLVLGVALRRREQRNDVYPSRRVVVPARLPT